jgi:rod shape-determining protein MreB and related proteins
MLANAFFITVYIRVKRNQFRVRYLESGIETIIEAQKPFTTARLLIGQFVSAQATLKDGLKNLTKGRFFPVVPRLVIHPMEMVEGGLSEVEERILREVAISAGASKVIVWVGRELNDAEVKEKLNEK